MNLEDLRRAGMSHTRLGWATNPVRQLLFRLSLPYFESFAREMERPRDDDGVRAALADMQARLAQADARLTERIQAEIPAGRAELRHQLTGVRNEMLALSHRFVSIEGTLEETSRWLADVERHSAELANEVAAVSDMVKTELATFHGRLLIAERSTPPREGAAAGSSAPSASPLLVADGPFGRFLVRHPDVVGDAIIRGEFWDPHLKDAIEANARQDQVAIDAGAYIGFHSVFLSRHFGRVYAFEPQRHAYHLLCANIELNGCNNIEAAELGLYSRPCWLRLAPDELQEIPIPRAAEGIDYARLGNAAALSFVASEEGTGDAVRAVSIDSLRLDNVGFIKVDTQGADLRVLQGAEETIRRCRPIIAFEFERGLSATHETRWPDVEAFFADLGYTLAVARRTEGDKQTDYLATPAR